MDGASKIMRARPIEIEERLSSTCRKVEILRAAQGSASQRQDIRRWTRAG
jgi:hypothetical protein